MSGNRISPVTLILGGARSGKSKFAEELAVGSGRSRVYLATSEAFDGEMTARISRHQEERGIGWTTVEEPLNLTAALEKHSTKHNIILVDCLTLWLSNVMGREMPVVGAIERLVLALPDLPGPVLFVSNEVGQGIVPDNALARAFRDHAGRLHQRLAAAAETVYFVTAGIPQILKQADHD
ncbi:bifunctional adenosylcobinamide kinase/adenosylcobinamide-phosphate guanylyltransferase [Sneathiella sp.]|uniref:bifunctional adenosylcobinamide kinase/adenosylcobinamide-phosphate guanylyltransferase n=1 Tax=Sneathiella sp. TaxID=1964365 RepID=UPI0035682D6F